MLVEDGVLKITSFDERFSTSPEPASLTLLATAGAASGAYALCRRWFGNKKRQRMTMMS
jgi:hypothetical protein